MTTSFVTTSIGVNKLKPFQEMSYNLSSIPEKRSDCYNDQPNGLNHVEVVLKQTSFLDLSIV